MSIPDGLRVVDAAFHEFYCQPAEGFHLPQPLKTLELEAVSRARATNTVFGDRKVTCGVEYTENHHEILIWHISLMFAQYVAGLLAKKAEDGHCRNHPKPCDLTRELHLRMLGRFKVDLLKLIDEITSIENNASKTWPTASSVPTLGTADT